MSSTPGTTPRFGPVRDSKDTSRGTTIADGDLEHGARSSIDFKELYFAYHGLIDDVSRWLAQERKGFSHKRSKSLLNTSSDNEPAPESFDTTSSHLKSLESLEKIISDSLSHINRAKSSRNIQSSYDPGASRRRLSLVKRYSRRGTIVGAGSDTDTSDIDFLVPSCEAILDNSKTLSYSSEPPVTASNLSIRSRKSSAKDKEAWDEFKREIVRLAHTLRLKGWRKIPLERGCEIKVQRLSGALTNAVYHVTAPKELMASIAGKEKSDSVQPVKPPISLLLRIYGPQVEHLIDRESELSVLRRLAQRHIGPCLLGTFTNGRFEEFLHSRTLTTSDIRNPDYSIKIAKRMRELHEGVQLLDSERENGPRVWRNWEGWSNRASKIMQYVDAMSTSYINQNQDKSGIDRSGYVTGVPWPLFKNAVEKYKKWLYEQYGGIEAIKENLVFAHNDAQGGNILRLVPSGESPLLLPANEHKQLVVIDFEYAGPNLRGLEFANHFTEWCYNYHDPDKPFAININNFPSLEEQKRFVRAYVEHSYVPTRPPSQFPSPEMAPVRNKSSSAITPFNLDTCSSSYQMISNDDYVEMQTNERVESLLQDMRNWRPANSVQWVTWGIVQAKIPGLKLEDENTAGSENENTPKVASPSAIEGGEPLPASGRIGSDALDAEGEAAVSDLHNRRPEYVPPEAITPSSNEKNKLSAEEETSQYEKMKEDQLRQEEEDEEENDEEFDCLAYAHDRAMFFFGDLLSLGVLKDDDLPPEVLQKVKRTKE